MDLSLIAHVSGGAIGLLAGGMALSVKKGGELHKLAGYTFVAAMTVMAATGGVVSYAAEKPFDVLSSWLTGYMILTAWLAFSAPAKSITIGLMCLGGGCLVGYLAVETYAVVTGVRATDAPVGAGFVFASIMGLALIGDYKSLIEPYARKMQVARHLWRMNFGLLIATASFFGARPQLFPIWMQESGILLILSFAPLTVIAYWKIRLRTRALSGV